MAEIMVRNIEEDVLERLKQKARENQRSLSAEIRAALSMHAYRMTRREFARKLDAIRAMTPKDVPQTDSTEIIRRDRDGRARDV